MIQYDPNRKFTDEEKAKYTKFISDMQDGVVDTTFVKKLSSVILSSRNMPPEQLHTNPDCLLGMAAAFMVLSHGGMLPAFVTDPTTIGMITVLMKHGSEAVMKEFVNKK